MSSSITQAQFAIAIGVAQSALSQIEAGKVEPRKATLQRIAETLADDLGELSLRQFLADRPVESLQSVVARLAAMIGDNEFLLMRVVVALADRLPSFARFFEARDLLEMRSKNAQMDEMIGLFKDDKKEWGDYLTKAGFLTDNGDVNITNSEMTISPVIAHIGPGQRTGEGERIERVEENRDIEYIRGEEDLSTQRRKGAKTRR